MQQEVMYSIQHKTYVTVYEVDMEKEQVFFRDPIEHRWLSSSIHTMIPKKEWENFLNFYKKWKNLKHKEYKAPKVHIASKRGVKDGTVFFVADEDMLKTASFNIYNTYEEAEEALKICFYKDYYCVLSEEEKKEILEGKESNYV